MHRWSSRGGKSGRRHTVRREEVREERVRRKKIKVREKVEQSRNTVFFQCFVAPEGRKVGSQTRRVRSHVVRWEMKKCTPLWCEAHLQVKTLKTPHVRSTFENRDVEKVRASTFRSQHCKSTACSDHFLSLRCRFAWQAQGILRVAKSEQNVRVLLHFQKRWQVWDV
jgi:hypothetical protein